jgi:hypothetical protein
VLAIPFCDVRLRGALDVCGTGGGCIGAVNSFLPTMRALYSAVEMVRVRRLWAPSPRAEYTDAALAFSWMWAARVVENVGSVVAVPMGDRTGNGKFAVNASIDDVIVVDFSFKKIKEKLSSSFDEVKTMS